MTIFKGRPVSLLGSGIYVPEKVLTNYDLERWLIPAMSGFALAPA